MPEAAASLGPTSDSCGPHSARPANHECRISDRRRMGGPTPGPAADRLRGPSAQRATLRLGSWDGVRVLQPGLCDPGSASSLPPPARAMATSSPPSYCGRLVWRAPPSPPTKSAHAHSLMATETWMASGKRSPSLETARSRQWGGCSAACAICLAGLPASRTPFRRAMLLRAVIPWCGPRGVRCSRRRR